MKSLFKLNRPVILRQTVDEKLQKTLEEKMNKSFSLVNERLEQVYKGLGEMQTLAVGVGDLKKVLSNVKTRGILGEIQLGAILSEILTKEQYEENIATKKGSKNVVEFAIKLPSDGAGTVYLPVDSKFPLCSADQCTYREYPLPRLLYAEQVLFVPIQCVACHSFQPHHGEQNMYRPEIWNYN